MRLLIVEDESSIAQRIETTCISDGISCDIAEDGTEALEMIKLYDYDAVILDLMLPDINGFEVLSRLRAIKNGTPVIILSGLNSTDDKVKCLTIGADDYLTKPFSKVELLARIYAVIRRTSGHFSSVINIGPLEIDIKRCVKIYDVEMPLTKKEYSILELLALKKGTVLPKEAFLNHIYGGLDEPEVKIVDVFICKLRKKIADMTGGLNFIETVWGRGYMLRDFEDAAEHAPVNTLMVS
ncbi:MAG: response regulator transcription factor [Holosporales bacterium]|jgi:two-component system cell cycle response regulator CtrA|nr:response regulator transcription factor [Holosporales bacterium]